MRFLYGLVLGVMLTLISSILYLALAGGDYLLALSPRYQEMRTRLEPCEKVEKQRDLLTERLTELEKRFTELSQRFTELQSAERAGGTTDDQPGAPAVTGEEPAP